MHPSGLLISHVISYHIISLSRSRGEDVEKGKVAAREGREEEKVCFFSHEERKLSTLSYPILSIYRIYLLYISFPIISTSRLEFLISKKKRAYVGQKRGEIFLPRRNR